MRVQGVNPYVAGMPSGDSFLAWEEGRKTGIMGSWLIVGFTPRISSPSFFESTSKNFKHKFVIHVEECLGFDRSLNPVTN